MRSVQNGAKHANKSRALATENHRLDTYHTETGISQSLLTAVVISVLGAVLVMIVIAGLVAYWLARRRGRRGLSEEVGSKDGSHVTRPHRQNSTFLIQVTFNFCYRRRQHSFGQNEKTSNVMGNQLQKME